MKKITLLLSFILLSFTFVNAQTVDINYNATSFSPAPDPADGIQLGVGFLNVYENPKDGTVGGFQFASGWGVTDLIAINDTGTGTLTLLPNRIGDTNIYWQTTGVLEGNKLMEANHYIQDDDLVGNTINFYGNVQSNTLDNGATLSFEFRHVAFVKVFNADYSAVVAESTHDLGTTGDFMISVDATSYPAGYHVQYGFQVFGPNINSNGSFDAAYAALGSIVIGPNTTLGTNDFKIAGLKLYPNPTNDSWTISTRNIKMSTIQVFDILGKQVLSLAPNAIEANIDASALKSGLYFAKINTDNGSSSLKLVRQ